MNNLEQEFIKKYNLTQDNWEDFCYGELGSDEEIIEVFLDKKYRIRYDEDRDSFIIKKKNSKKIDFTIIQEKNEDVIEILAESGVYSEYEPRFSVYSNNILIGGSSYEIDEENIYNFDIGILEEYTGIGISKKLIQDIINDAKKLKCDGIKALVVNNQLFRYLGSIGFNLQKDSDTNYAYLDF